MTYEYVAGFFDGDGCIAIGEGKTNKKWSNTYQLIVKISQKDSEVIKKLHSFIGLGTLYAEKRKEATYLRMVSNEAKKFLERIEPFLVAKKTEARLGIQFQKGKSQEGRGWGKHLSDKELRWRKMHKTLISMLNQRY